MPMPECRAPLLAVEDLCIEARTPQGPRPLVEALRFTLAPGETLCIAGESGSGKSLTALAIMRLLGRGLRLGRGTIRLAGRDLTSLPEAEMRALRGRALAMIFQEPTTALNPVMTIGAQVTEAIRAHAAGGAASAASRARAMLDAVRIDDPGRRLRQYPFELSGGMRQRVMIGMALACRPAVLIADEPTTALDVTVQAQILALLRELSRDFGTSIILITHDMGVAAAMADRVVLMRRGRLVEEGPAEAIFSRPQAAYTRRLLAAVPRLGSHAGQDGPPRLSLAPPRSRPATPVLCVRGLCVSYAGPRGFGRAAAPPVVADVGFVLQAGETLGLVGESGSGKSTTGKAVLGLVAFEGEVVIDGTAIAGLSEPELWPLRRKAQMIFQDAAGSLDPRMTVGAAIAEPLKIHRIGGPAERRERVAALLRRVHLSPDHALRLPHQCSGGERQRICIARALALGPRLIVADESVSALDVSVRRHVLDLLLELQEDLGLAYLLISHDMAVVERMSHHVAVMRMGRIVEQGTRRAVFESPAHPYTQALLAAVPRGLPVVG